MNEMIFPLAQNDLSAKKHSEDDVFQAPRKLWQMSAIIYFTIGFLSLILGILLLFIAWFTNSPLSGVLAKWALIAPIPLMMFGAHCLDKLDFIEKAAKKKRLDN